MSVESKVRAVTTLRLKEMKDRGEKIAMLTSYDYSMAKIVDAAGVDVILVGDSAANVMAGYETTVPITLDAMIYHARSVVRAVERALVVVDLPFRNLSGQFEDGPRLGHPDHEGDRGRRREARRRRGDTRIGRAHPHGRHSDHGASGAYAAVDPQVRHLYRPRQGKRPRPKSWCATHVFWKRPAASPSCSKKIPAVLAERVSKELSIPTIGIGAGGGTDGQVLVIHDMLGINKGFSPASCAATPTCIR